MIPPILLTSGQTVIKLSVWSILNHICVWRCSWIKPVGTQISLISSTKQSMFKARILSKLKNVTRAALATLMIFSMSALYYILNTVHCTPRVYTTFCKFITSHCKHPKFDWVGLKIYIEYVTFTFTFTFTFT